MTTIAPTVPPVPRSRAATPGARSVDGASGADQRPRYARTTHPGARAALGRLLADHGWTLGEPPGERSGPVAVGPVAVGPEGIACDVLMGYRPDDAARRATQTARLDALAIDHDHVAGVHAVLDAGHGRLVVLRLAVDGTPLDDVVAARGALTAAEASGVLVGLGQALAALHDARSSAWLAGAEVVVTAAGRVVLLPSIDAGFPGDGAADRVTGGHGTVAEADAADDVRCLARLTARLLPGAIGHATRRADPPAARYPRPRARPATIRGTFAGSLLRLDRWRAESVRGGQRHDGRWGWRRGAIGRAATRRDAAGAEEAARIATLVGVIAPALRDDPRERPAVGTLAARCHDAVAPAPVVVPPAPAAGGAGAVWTGAPRTTARTPATGLLRTGLLRTGLLRTGRVRASVLGTALRRPTGMPRRGRRG